MSDLNDELLLTASKSLDQNWKSGHKTLSAMEISSFSPQVHEQPENMMQISSSAPALNRSIYTKDKLMKKRASRQQNNLASTSKKMVVVPSPISQTSKAIKKNVAKKVEVAQ